MHSLTQNSKKSPQKSNNSPLSRKSKPLLPRNTSRKREFQFQKQTRSISPTSTHPTNNVPRAPKHLSSVEKDLLAVAERTQTLELKDQEKKCQKIANELRNILLRVETHYTKFALAFDHDSNFDPEVEEALEKLKNEGKGGPVTGNLDHLHGNVCYSSDDEELTNLAQTSTDPETLNHLRLQKRLNKKIKQQKTDMENFLSKLLLNTSKIASTLFGMLEESDFITLEKDPDFKNFLETTFLENRQEKHEIKKRAFKVISDFDKLDLKLKNLSDVAEDFFVQVLRARHGGHGRGARDKNNSSRHRNKSDKRKLNNKFENPELENFYKIIESDYSGVCDLPDDFFDENSDLLVDEIIGSLKMLASSSSNSGGGTGGSGTTCLNSLLTHITPQLKTFINNNLNEKSTLKLKISELYQTNSHQTSRISSLEAALKQSNNYFEASQQKIKLTEDTIKELKNELSIETEYRKKTENELEALLADDRLLENRAEDLKLKIKNSCKELDGIELKKEQFLAEIEELEKELFNQAEQTEEFKLKNAKLQRQMNEKQEEMENQSLVEANLRTTVKMLEDKLLEWEVNLAKTFNRKLSQDDLEYDRDYDDLLESVTSLLSNVTEKAVSVQSSALFREFRRRSSSRDLLSGTESLLSTKDGNIQNYGLGPNSPRISTNNLNQQAKNTVTALNKLKSYYQNKITKIKSDKEYLEDCYDQFFSCLKVLKNVGAKIIRNNYGVLSDSEVCDKSINNNLTLPNLLLPDYTICTGEMCHADGAQEEQNLKIQKISNLGHHQNVTSA